MGGATTAAQPAAAPSAGGVALCLSGGGFRASLFHMGVLRYLAEAGALGKVSTISTVSGGSIFGAFVAARWDDLAQLGHSLAAYDAFIRDPFSSILIEHNLRNRWLASSILRLPELLRPSFSRGNVLVETFDRWLYGGKTMPELSQDVDLVLNATSLATGRHFRFRRDSLGEWEFGYPGYGDSPVLLAYAVVASSAAPFVVPPVRLDTRPYAWPGNRHNSQARPQGDIWLADGGVYDNLGLEWFMGEHGAAQTIIVSEASGGMRQEWKSYRLAGIARRAQAIQYEQSRAVRQRWLDDQMRLQRRLKHWGKTGKMERALADRLAAAAKSGAIISIDKAVETMDWLRLPAPGALPASLVAQVAAIRTDLDSFSPREIELLSYHGYWLAHVYLSHFQPQLALREPSWRLDLSPAGVAAYAGALARGGKSTARRTLW